MYENPFFDPSKLSDEEILKQLNDLGQRLMVAHYTSTNHSIRDQLNGMIEALNEERMNRMAKQASEAWDKMFPDVIESDPEFKKDRGESPQQKTTVVKPVQGQKKNLGNQVFHKEPFKKDGNPTKPNSK